MKHSPFDSVSNIVADPLVKTPNDVRFMSLKNYVATFMLLLVVFFVSVWLSSGNIWVYGVGFALVFAYSQLFFIYRGKIEIALLKKSYRALVFKLGYSFADEADRSSLCDELAPAGIVRTKTIKNVISGEYLGYPMRSYDYVSSEGLLRFIFEITTEVSFPKLVLSSKADSWSQVSDIERVIDGGDMVELEGNFGKLFSVVIEKGKQNELRQILTPDVMAVMMDDGKQFSYLFSGHRLHLIHYQRDGEESDFSGKETLKLHKEAEHIVSKLVPNFSSLHALEGADESR